MTKLDKRYRISREDIVIGDFCRTTSRLLGVVEVGDVQVEEWVVQDVLSSLWEYGLLIDYELLIEVVKCAFEKTGTFKRVTFISLARHVPTRGSRNT